MARIEDAQRFLDLIDPEAETWRFRTFPDDRKGAGHNVNGELDSKGTELQLDNGKGRGVFVVINEGDHTDDSITRIRAVYADFDPPKTNPMPARFDLEPHLIVESSPGCHHAYWLVDGLAVGDFKRAQQAIAARYGSDPAVCNPSRVMRLPGFLHQKGEPFQSRIIHESGAQPYAAETILAAFSAVVDKPHRAPADDAKLSDGRRCDLYKAGCDYRDQGARGKKLLQLLRGYNLANFEPPKPDAEVAETARNVERYARNKDAPLPSIGNASDLLQRQFQPVQWAVQGILPEGITILSGDPKIGKSWLLYQACVAVAAGKPLWIGREPEAAGDALMLALEDNDRRLQRRLQTLLPRFSTFQGTRILNPDVSRLHYATEWPRGEAGATQLGAWLREHPNCRLIVVDTVSAFRDPDPGKKSAYAHDYAVGELFKPLAREYSCAIVLVMHNRKQHSADALQLVSGTQGMTGGVDNVLVQRRERGQLDAGLYVDGRDIEEPQEMALRFDNGYWCGTGQSVEEAKLSKERRQVIRAVVGLGAEAKVKAIAAEFPKKKYASLKSLLSKMVKAGDLTLSEGVYTHTGTVGTVGTE